MKVKGTYVSIWDGGFCVESDMIADTESRTFEIIDEAVDFHTSYIAHRH